MSSLFILGTNHLLNIDNIHTHSLIFYQFVACLLIFLMVAFDEKLLILLKSNLFIIFLLWFLFCFVLNIYLFIWLHRVLVAACRI